MSLFVPIFALLVAAPTGSLDKGAAALSDFRPQEALRFLQKAEGEGPYRFEDKVRLHEQLGIAYAYLERNEDALEQFARVLLLDPGHLISYTLSPKVTFVFEKARQEAQTRIPIIVDVTWPRGLNTEAPIPIDVEVISDPPGLLVAAELHYRLKSDVDFQTVRFDVETSGLNRREQLPPLAMGSTKDKSIEIWVSFYDKDQNEVFRWGGPRRLREIALTYVTPDSWYEKWWVWTLVGTAVAAGTGVGVFMATQQPPDQINGTFEVFP